MGDCSDQPGQDPQAKFSRQLSRTADNRTRSKMTPVSASISELLHSDRMRRSFDIDRAPLLSKSQADGEPSSSGNSGGVSSGSVGGGSPLSSWPLLVGMCAFSVVICYADRANISTAILPMSEAFGWDKASAGIGHLMSTYPETTYVLSY